MESPFVFGQIARGQSFVNRTRELKQLGGNFTSGTNTMMISPRRWGKSSLVINAADQVKKSNREIRICHLDLFRIRDEEHFFESYAKAVLKASSGKWQEWMSTAKELLAGIVSSVSIGTDPVNDFSLKLSWEKSVKDEGAVLDLPEKIATRKKLRFVICIDEFQKIAEYEESQFLQQRLRSAWQGQRHTSYCLYGSKRHVISNLFTSQSQPFYQFGDLIFLQKIDKEHWYNYISDGFASTGKQIEREIIDDILSVTANHPYHVQQLAHHIWRQTVREATPDVFTSSLEELLLNNEILFRKEVESVTSLQLGYLEALINKERHLNSAESIMKYNLGSPGNLSTIKSALESKEIIDFYEREATFVNPLFEYWLREYFFAGR
jgi:hypothetical protein